MVSFVMVAGLSTTLLTSSWGVSPPRHEAEGARGGIPEASTYRPESEGLNSGKVDENGGDNFQFPLTDTVTVTLPRDQGWVLLYFNNTTAPRLLSDSTAGNAPELSRMVLALDSLTGDNFPCESPNAALALRASPTFMASGPAFAGIGEAHLGQAVIARFDAGEPAGDVSAAASPSSVPEPTTMLLIGTGLAGLAARAKRRRGPKT
jgi:hypothetical protein